MLSVTRKIVRCRCWMLLMSHVADWSLSLMYFLQSSALWAPSAVPPRISR